MLLPVIEDTNDQNTIGMQSSRDLPPSDLDYNHKDDDYDAGPRKVHNKILSLIIFYVSSPAL